MKLTEISAEPLVVTLYNKIKDSKDWGVYWVDTNGVGHSILDFEWVPAEMDDTTGKITKEKIVVTLNSQNRPKPRSFVVSGAAIDKLRLKKMLVPKQFAVDHERWYLVKGQK